MSQVTPGRSQRPAVRAAFGAFTGRNRDSGNNLKNWQVSDFGVTSEEKSALWRQLSPGPYCPNDLRRGLLWLQGAFDRRNRHHEEGRPTIKICTAENKEKVLPSADVPGRELHHCLQRKGVPAQGKKYVSELITLAVCGGYSRRGVVWYVATEGGEKNAENIKRFLLWQPHTW